MGNSKPKYTKEEIEWEKYYIPKMANKLLIGTFPTDKSKRPFKEFEFFYPNPNNPMWEILSKIAKINFDKSTFYKNKQNAYKVLAALNLGVTDMANKVYRLGGSSLDQSLFPLEFMDIFSILNKHPKIRTLILTSSSGPNSVASWFKNYCSQNGKTIKISKEKKPLSLKLSLEGEAYNIIIVSSTSRAHSGDRRAKEKQYQDAILHNIPNVL